MVRVERVRFWWALLVLVSVRLPVAGATLLAQFPFGDFEIAACCATGGSPSMEVFLKMSDSEYALRANPRAGQVFNFYSGPPFDVISSRLTNGIDDRWRFGIAIVSGIPARSEGAVFIPELAVFCGQSCSTPPPGFGPDLIGDQITLIQLFVRDYRVWSDTPTCPPPYCGTVHATANVTWLFYGNGEPYPQSSGPLPNPVPEPATLTSSTLALAGATLAKLRWSRCIAAAVRVAVRRG